MTSAINMCQFIIFTEVHKWVGIDYFRVKREKKSWIVAHGLDKPAKQSAVFSLAKWVVIFLVFLPSVSSRVSIFFMLDSNLLPVKGALLIRFN